MQSHTTHSTVHKLCVLLHFHCSVYASAPEGGIAGGEGEFDKQEKKKNENTDMMSRVTFLLGSQKFLGFCFFQHSSLRRPGPCDLSEHAQQEAWLAGGRTLPHCAAEKLQPRLSPDQSLWPLRGI